MKSLSLLVDRTVASGFPLCFMGIETLNDAHSKCQAQNFQTWILLQNNRNFGENATGGLRLFDIILQIFPQRDQL